MKLLLLIVISSAVLVSEPRAASTRAHEAAAGTRHRRAATARLDRLWDDAVIPYEIDRIFSDERAALFRAAMRHWENNTCIKFVERNPEEHRNYIVFTERSCGCCSFVGKRGNGPQAISIGKHCDKFGIVVHELGHVVGFWHEHTRPDRDQHVQIVAKNIMAGQEYNFNKLTRDEVNSLGLAYDYDSILHYATNTFARDTYLDTILPLHGHLNTEEVGTQPAGSGAGGQLPVNATGNSAAPPALAPSLNSSTGAAGEPASRQTSASNATNPHMINDQLARAEKIRDIERRIESDFQSMMDYARPSRHRRAGASGGAARLGARVVPIEDGVVIVANGDSSRRATGASRRARRAAPVDADDGERMLATDNLLAKVRPEIGQRVRLSVGDIAQTNLLYRCPKCGRTIHQLAGIFHSPGYHSGPAPSQDVGEQARAQHADSCEWRLAVGSGERILINIADLDLAVQPPAGHSNTDRRPLVQHSRLGLPRSEPAQPRAEPRLDEPPDPMIMNDCLTDYLEIRDGYTHRAPVIARLCGHISRLRDINRPIVSTANRLLVSYHTSSKSAGKRGFLAHHETICGGFILLGNALPDPEASSQNSNGARPQTGQPAKFQLAPTSGRLSGPAEPAASRSSANGSSSSENEVLLSSQTNARGASVQAHPAQNASAAKAELEQAGRSPPPASNATSGPTGEGPGSSWDLWPALNTSSIQSPNWPEHYRASRECLWQIRAEENYQIALRFETFELEAHDSCAYDYVEVRDGESSSSELLGRFCGNRLPQQLLSSGPSMLVRFVSDSDVNKTGFLASVQPEIDECKLGTHGCSYKCSNAAIPYRCECPQGLELAPDGKSCVPTCGGLRNDSSGQISSPAFPDLYPISTRCVWEIRAPANHRISLNFTHFDLEGIRAQECDYDYVELWSRTAEGKSLKSGTYCGQNQPFAVTSAANWLRVEFVSDNSIQKSGFEASYLVDRDECAANNGGCQQLCKNTIGSYQCSCTNGFLLHENKHHCTGTQNLQTISAPDGSFSTPNFPNLYEANKEHAWRFLTAPGHRIKLIFDQFDLESHQECTYDHVDVFDGESVEDHRLGRFCGSRRPLTLVSSFNTLYLIFHSDATNEKRGFNATHTTVCGGRLQANANQPAQIHSHPLFDGATHYSRNEDCDWIIEANENQRVRIEFTFFALEPDTNCNYDQTLVYDGSDEAAAQLARLCGTDIPKEQLRITSSGDSMLIVFKSDDSINSKGFSLTYTAVELNEDETLAITYATEAKFAQPS